MPTPFSFIKVNLNRFNSPFPGVSHAASQSLEFAEADYAGQMSGVLESQLRRLPNSRNQLATSPNRL
ncbi:MAG: hypothetical protein WCC94_12890 [Candidatus Bathyarchaeia archaeon]